MAIAPPDDQREHAVKRGERRPGQADGLGFEAQFGGHSYRQAAFGFAGLQCEVVDQALWQGRYAMVLRHCRKALDGAVRVGGLHTKDFNLGKTFKNR